MFQCFMKSINQLKRLTKSMNKFIKRIKKTLNQSQQFMKIMSQFTELMESLSPLTWFTSCTNKFILLMNRRSQFTNLMRNTSPFTRIIKIMSKTLKMIEKTSTRRMLMKKLLNSMHHITRFKKMKLHKSKLDHTQFITRKKVQPLYMNHQMRLQKSFNMSKTQKKLTEKIFQLLSIVVFVKNAISYRKHFNYKLKYI